MNYNWHNLESDDVLKNVDSSINGLSDEEATVRLNKYGKNILPKKAGDGFLKIMFRQFLDPIVLLLVVAVIFSFIIGEVIDALAIIFIILVDLLMGTFQEWKASKEALALSNLIKVNVNVLRNNSEKAIDSSLLVKGDIVFVSPGCKISADMRVIESKNLTVDESTLTGESVNVSKVSTILDKDVLLANRSNMLYAGTSVITGRGIAVVVETGVNTEIGKIVDKVSNTKEAKSPLTIRMNKFSKQISLLIIVVGIIIAVLLFSKGVNSYDIFLSVIALSVSAMPEGLPLALTMALTIASSRMVKKNVIVKKLNSVESLGSCTVIASDKTGTLTVNEQTAKKILLPDGSEYDISGIGYNDIGEITGDNLNYAYDIAKLGVINNEASLKCEKDKFTVMGDSIDVAFLALGMKANVDIKDIKVCGKIPYESENKYSAIFYNDRVTVKGSLEKVLTFCNSMLVSGEVKKLDVDKLIKQNEDLANLGYRVIALADGGVEASLYSEKEINNLTFVGMVAFIDPIRDDIKDSVLECRRAGIKVVMITGDHPLTAYSIAKEIGIASCYDEVATSDDVAVALAKGYDYFDQFVREKRIFTRVTPLDKFEIVESYKRQGEFVAVTGDGVNDAPALKSANIGIAMGSGTDVAKETSSMIIVDDSFKSIVAGIKEGRCAYSNIRKISYMLLSCGVAEVLFFILSIVFNKPMPLVAIQLLWLNIVTDGLQDLALSFEKAEDGITNEMPRSTKESLFNKELFTEVMISGFLIGIVVFIVFVKLLNSGMDIETVRGYILMLMVFMQNIHVLNCRSEKLSVFKVSIKKNPFIIFSIVGAIVLQIIMMEVPVLATFLQTNSIPIIEIIKLFLYSLIVLIVMEIYKFIRYRKR